MDAHNSFVHKNQSGLTLSELMIALTIGTILITMAIPAFSSMLEENQMMAKVYSLVEHLNYARQTAITQYRNITLCKSSDGKACDDELEWEDGWIVFEDISNDHLRDEGEPLLRVQNGSTNKLTIDYTAGFGKNNYVVFKPMGNSSYNGTFTFCTDNSEISPRAVIVFRGRVRISRTKPGDAPITCPN